MSSSKLNRSFLRLTIWALLAMSQFASLAQAQYGGDHVARSGGQYSNRYLPPVMPPGQPVYQQPYQQPIFPNGVNQQPWNQNYGYGVDQCQAARMEQNQAQYGLVIAVNNLNNIGEMCNGETMCILGYQNVYNQARINVENAQKKVDRYCTRPGLPF